MARSDGFVPRGDGACSTPAPARTPGGCETNHQPQPEWESVLYGAAGVARNAELTRLLLDRGADPNDEETPYHAPETYDNEALKVLVESGKLNDDSLAIMLLRKADWHDLDGIRYLLECGADPNRLTRWHLTALHQALRRDNALEIIEVLLDTRGRPERSRTVGMAGHRPRSPREEDGETCSICSSDEAFRSSFRAPMRLIAACARNDGATVCSIAGREPELVREVLAEGGTLLAEFAGNGNTDGIRHFLDLGVDVAALYREGDRYFDIAQGQHGPSCRGLACPARDCAGSSSTAGRRSTSWMAKGERHWPSPFVPAWTRTGRLGARPSRSRRCFVRARRQAASNLPSGYAEVDELLRLYGK